MTLNDTTPEPTDEPPRRCAALRLEGAVVVYDPEHTDRWIQSTVALPLTEVT